MASTAVFTALNDAVVKSATQLETSGQITPATTDEDSKSPTPSKDSMGDGMGDPSDALMIVTSDDEEDADDCDALMYPEVKLQEHNDDIATIVSDTNNNDDDVSSQHSIEVTPDIHEGDDHDDDMMANSEATHNLLSSLSTLMAMAANAKNQGKRPSGKLDKITQKLAQKQLNNGESLLNAFSPSSSSAGAPSDSAGTASGSNVDTSPEDECDEEDMQNSLRALGLMGTAADFQTAGEYKCPLCDLKLDTQHSFTLHIRSHNPSDHSNTCQLCGKTLSSASSLDRHMLIHSGERPFKCSICNMAFTTNGNMHRHMRTHGHGAIGYTPRGAKRRAKLFAQQAAKVAAAAAAGEIVDASTLSKLKKAAIEVTTGNGKSPISGEVKKLTRGRRTSDNFEDAVQLNAVQTVIETKTIADAAAAFVSAIATADSKKSKNTPAPVGSPSFVQFPFASQSTLDFEVKPKRKPGRKRKIQPEDGAPEQMSPGSGHMPTNNSHSFNGSSMNNSTVSCPICSLSVSGKMDLHGHMVGFHRQEPLFCLDCGMILDNYDVYIHHQCTFSAAMVMAAIRQNPNMSSEVLFPSTNTGRMNFSSLAAMTGKKPAPAPTSAPAVPAPVTNNASFDALFQSLSQQLQNSQKSQLSPGLVDLSKKVKQSVPQQQQQQPSPLGGGGGAQCNTCARRFNNTRDLKKHFDTFCHDCSLDCGTSAMFLTHSLSHGFDKFPALSKALSGAQNGQGASPPTTTEQLVASLLAAQGVNPFLNMHQTKTSLSGAGSSLASLTSTMADMTDLADIQSIISMANKANKLPTSATTNNFNKSDPISPNRATDAESGKKMLQMNAGDASHHHPDSPASADSAGIALAHTHHGQSSSTGTAATDSGHESANTNEFATMKDEHFDDDDDEPNLKRARKSDDEEGLDLSVDGTTRKFRCEPCRLSFRSLNAFKRHNRGHTAGGGHSHACTQCPYKSLDKSTLIRHLRTHNGERPFQCSICKYAFTTKANCERHVKKRHRDLKTPVEIRQAMQFNEDIAATAAATRLVAEKIFIERDELPTSQDTVCKQCKVDHGTNKALRAHLRVPNNPCSAELKPFVCTICRVAFNTRNNCVRHILKQHPSTIEVTDEEAAKVVAAVNGQVDTTAESLIRDDSVSGGSGSPSLDNSFMSASGSSDEGEYDDGEPMDSDKSPFASPNASLDALFRVAGVEAESVRRNGGGPLNLSSKSPESKPTPLDFSIKPETSALLSHPSFGQFFGQADMFAHNPGLLALYRAEQEQQKQQQQQQLAAVASAAMSGAFDMSAFAKTFNPAAMLSAAAAPSPLGGVMSANDTLAHLMAQFHQQQQIALKSLSKHH